MNLLLIDAGHAKNTPGKNNAKENFYEWEFNNYMQYKVKKRAEDHGIYVFLSNPNPEKISDIGLTQRANSMSNHYVSKGKPKSLMISIHANAYNNTSARGTETYVASNASQSSKIAAKYIQGEIFKCIKNLDSNAKDRGVKKEDFTVIYKTIAPCCLIEYAFYSNISDLKILKNNRDELVEATIKGICKYFEIEYKPINNTNNYGIKVYDFKTKENALLFSKKMTTIENAYNEVHKNNDKWCVKIESFSTKESVLNFSNKLKQKYNAWNEIYNI
ncbi:N-acetylmuramoyl-L-alanine amidase family protein [Romboutsia lituseburensis]|uniref:N-acetylmuramoyl-L-alanine amidase family protein n=1 Tax=Romboutsia lituseburensis TaxID=1537 RepID=UPI00215A978B|nr:N-acetylmuramoyl-L-alanine amidase [Romboutsia lituseburensis]MCR8744328.1 N-acetylmuramoyl-L-alanine amidase [Romboutsia lituseburensis]